MLSKPTPKLKKALFVITKSEVGGAQVHLLQILRNLISHYEVMLVVGDRGYLTKKAEELGVRFELNCALKNSISLSSDMKGLLALTKLVKDFKPDLIHAHSSKAGAIARIAGFLTRTPVLFTVHGWSFSPGVPFFARTRSIFFEWLLSFFPSTFVCVSSYDLALGRKYGIIRSSQAFVIHNGIGGVGDGKTAYPSGDEGNRFRLIMVARFCKQKKHEELLEVFSRLPSATELVLVGDGPDRSEIELVSKRMNISDRVRFEGLQSDVNSFLKASDCFILLSRYEGLPISVLEAMRAGLPVVASDVGGNSEAVTNGVTGWLVGSDVDEIARKVRQLIDQPDVRRAFGLAGMRKFQSSFSESAMLDKVATVYQRVTGRCAETKEF